MTEATLTATRTADAEESVPRSTGALAHIVTIAKRELVGYFESPIAYVFIVIFLLLVGFFTFMVSGFFERKEANLEPFSPDICGFISFSFRQSRSINSCFEAAGCSLFSIPRRSWTEAARGWVQWGARPGWTSC